MKTNFLQAYRAYRELIRNGEIQSVAEGEFLFLDIRGNITGDILVFISPKCKIISTGMDMQLLISSDNKLERQQKAAFNSLRQKLDGLTFIPQMLVWFFCIIVSIPYVWWRYESIHAFITGENVLPGIKSLLPLILLGGSAILLNKTIGFGLLKYIISIVMWFSRLVRLIRNRNVKEVQG